MRTKKILYGLIFCLLAIETTIHFKATSIEANAANIRKSLLTSTEIYKEGSIKQTNPTYSPVQGKEEFQELHEAIVSLNMIKALIVVSGCLFTAVVSLMGETLLKTIIHQIKDILIEIMTNQKYFENISAEEVVQITQLMRQTRIDIKATRLSMFKLYQDSHSVFLEVSSDSRYSLANTPPVARQFFDFAISPMIDDGQKYSYCGDHSDTCSTWLAGRGTGRYAIHLFFYKENFAGFILAEWKKLMLIDSLFKFDENSNNYEPKLKALADMISEAIKDKNRSC